MTNKNLFVISVIILCSAILVNARKFSFNKLECLEHNNDVCSDLSCSVGKKQKSLNLGCTLKQPTNAMKVSFFLSVFVKQI